MNANDSITFFDTQFQQQARDRDFRLNPFELAALPHLHGRVLDYGCGLGNLAFTAAERSCSVLVLDASPAAITHIKQRAAAEALPVHAALADLQDYELGEDFDSVVSIGLLMFFDCPTAFKALSNLQAHVREQLMSFTAAYLEIEASYLVPGSSPHRTATDVDRTGVRVAAPSRTNFELFLQRNLKQAQLVSVQGDDAAFNLLVTGKVEALAGVKQGLMALSEKFPGSRVVDGRFMAVQQSIAIPKGRDAGLAYLRSMVEDSKASGLVAGAIDRSGARGVVVAPPAIK